jgi:hypothetical protein
MEDRRQRKDMKKQFLREAFGLKSMVSRTKRGIFKGVSSMFDNLRVKVSYTT